MPLGQHEQVTARSLGDPTMPHQLEAGSLHQREIRRGVVVAPVHGRVVVFLRPGRQVRCAKAKKGQPSRPQHACKAIENSGVLFSAVPGYVTFGVRAGLKFGKHQLLLDAENMNDENYRGISWGIDAPGRGISIRYIARF